MKKTLKVLFLAVLSMMMALSVVACGKSDEVKKSDLITSVTASATIEVNTIFKPTVVILKDASYVLTAQDPSKKEVTVTDNAFTPTKLGSYSYKITAILKGRENEIKDMTVNVVDTSAPVFGGDVADKLLTKGSKLTFATLIEQLTVTDNFDKDCSITLKSLTFNDGNIDLNGATSYTFINAGMYKLTFNSIDSSGNVGAKVINVNVKGIDVNTTELAFIVGDNLSVPKYQMIPANSGRVDVYYGATKLDLTSLPIISAADIGTKNLEFRYFMTENKTTVADEVITVAVLVKDLTIAASCDFDGQDVGLVTSLPIGISNSTTAVVATTIITPVNSTATAVVGGAEYTFNEIGYYTLTYTATKGGISKTAVYKFYISAKGETGSFEDYIGSGKTWANSSVNGDCASIDTTERKYGENSVKFVLAKDKQVMLNYATADGMVVPATVNTLRFFVKTNSDTILQFGSSQNNNGNEGWIIDPNSSKQFSVSAGDWQLIEYAVTSPTMGGKLINFSITNKGSGEVIAHVDGITLVDDNHIVAKNASKEILKNAVIDLNKYFELFGVGVDATINIVATNGSIVAREFTAPNVTGALTITITVTEANKTTRILNIPFNVISVTFTLESAYNSTYEVGETITKIAASQVGGINPVIKLESVIGDTATLITGETFKFDTTGWITLRYTLTCDNETEPLVIENKMYLRDKGQTGTFEDYVGSGRKWENTAGSSASDVSATLDNIIVKDGAQSLKLELGAEKQIMLNYAESEYIAKAQSYNAITVWINASKASVVRLGFAQPKEGDWWFINPNESETYSLKTGWNKVEIYMATPRIGGSICAIALTNLFTEKVTYYVDSISFVSDMFVKATEASKSVVLNNEIDLTQFLTVVGAENPTVTFTVDSVAITGATHTFDVEKEYAIIATITKNGFSPRTFEFVISAVGVSITVDDYLNGIVGESCVVKPSVVVGATKSVVITLTLPSGATSVVAENSNMVLVAGWYKLEYVLTYATNLTKTVIKEFYVAEVGEVVSFENFANSGKDFTRSGGSSATSLVELATDQVKYGKQSMKFTNTNKTERAQASLEGVGAPKITTNDFTHIKMWIYSATAVKVVVAVQGGGANWGWLTSASDTSAFDLQAGWNEITLVRNDSAVCAYIAGIFVDKMTDGTNGTAESIYIDNICFIKK